MPHEETRKIIRVSNSYAVTIPGPWLRYFKLTDACMALLTLLTLHLHLPLVVKTKLFRQPVFSATKPYRQTQLIACMHASLSPSLGIPPFNRAEKLSEVIPVKVGCALKRAIPQPQSTWIKQAIIEKLQRLEEETG